MEWPLERSGEGRLWTGHLRIQLRGDCRTGTREIRRRETVRNGQWIVQLRGDSGRATGDQVRGDSTEWPMERSDEGTVQNSHWRDHVRGDNAERPLEISGEGTHCGMATG